MTIRPAVLQWSPTSIFKPESFVTVCLQAPASMKSVLQAAWLMTVAVGNGIVVLAAESSFIQNQVN